MAGIKIMLAKNHRYVMKNKWCFLLMLGPYAGSLGHLCFNFGLFKRLNDEPTDGSALRRGIDYSGFIHSRLFQLPIKDSYKLAIWTKKIPVLGIAIKQK